jgi:hypothetical protein
LPHVNLSQVGQKVKNLRDISDADLLWIIEDANHLVCLRQCRTEFGVHHQEIGQQLTAYS